MRCMLIISIFLGAAMWLSLATAQAEAPGLINHQGFLTDTDGVPIGGDMQMGFVIYDQQIDGIELWSEGPVPVTVAGGIFQVNLGQITPLTPAVLAGPRWLEVIVEGEAMEPRERIVSAPFAIKAMDAARVDGYEGVDLEESAEIDSDIAAHASVEDTHHEKTTSFAELIDSATDAQIPDTITIDFAAAAQTAATASDSDTVDGQHASEFSSAGHDHDGRYYTQAYVDALESRINSLESKVSQMEEFFQYVTVDGANITVSSANVHIVNGSGATDGAVNGFGNLIVGYNELRGEGDDRTGSHNIVVGKELNYSSYGGMIGGLHNAVSGRYATVSGGRNNEAGGDYSFVGGGGGNDVSDGNEAFGHYSAILGGFNNIAGDPALLDHSIGQQSSVSGGATNKASGEYSSISGGSSNTASGQGASVAGGKNNQASGYRSSVSGGGDNIASGNRTSVSGGRDNAASGESSSVSGGRNNIASGECSFVGGGGHSYAMYGNNAFGHYSAILGGIKNIAGDPDLVDPSWGQASTVGGGYWNTAYGYGSSVSGGQENEASGIYAIVSGGRNNISSGDWSFVGGGGDPSASFGNQAIGHYSAILGGSDNIAGHLSGNHSIGQKSTVSGGNGNYARALYASISGGTGGIASGQTSSISGGFNNTASGDYSSVSGGANRAGASGTHDWVAGSLWEEY